MEEKDKKLISIYRAIKEFMNFDDMLTGDYIVYIEDDNIYIKYNTRSDKINTEGVVICGNVKKMTYQELILMIWKNGGTSAREKYQKKISGLWYDSIEDLEYDVQMKILKEGVSIDWKEKYF